MSSTPKLTIATPVWNGISFIKEAVDSVLADEFQDWELIIADNGSTDGTSEYLRTLSDPRIRVYIHDKNYGVYYNIRFLWAKASTPYIYHLCADDYLFPGALRKILQAWETAPPSTAYITYNFRHRELNQNKLTAYGYEILPKVMEPTSGRLAFFMFDCIAGNLSEVCIRTDVALASADFDPNMTYSGDFEYWSRLAKQYPIVACDDRVVYIRRHNQTADFFLNKHGERFTQNRPVYERLIEELAPLIGRERLITFYQVESVAFQLHDALSALIFKRSLINMKSFLTAKSPILWPLWKRLLLLLPLSISENVRLSVAKWLARGIVKKWKEEQPTQVLAATA